MQLSTRRAGPGVGATDAGWKMGGGQSGDATVLEGGERELRGLAQRREGGSSVHGREVRAGPTGVAFQNRQALSKQC
jgi:hypothetical protein